MKARRFKLPVQLIDRDASAPRPWPISAVAPALVVCSVGNGGVTPGAGVLPAVYLLACERAAASVRPARYVHAGHASSN